MAWLEMTRKNSLPARGLLTIATLLATTVGIVACTDDTTGAGQPPIIWDAAFPVPFPDAGSAPDATSDAASDTVASPVFDPPGGSFTSVQHVTISTTTPGAVVHYTLDGTTPNAAAPRYDDPIDLTKTSTLKAIALKVGAIDSPVTTAEYRIDIPLDTVKPVQFSPSPGFVHFNDIDVRLTSDTADSTICYTLDGSLPSCDAQARCVGPAATYGSSAPIRIAQSGQPIRAVACKSGMITSTDTGAKYTLVVATPTFEPDRPDPNNPVPVTVRTATKGATIHYTTDGTTATCTTPRTFGESGSFEEAFKDDTRLDAVACKDGYQPSSHHVRTYLGTVCKGDHYVRSIPDLFDLQRCHEIIGRLSIRDVAGDLTRLRNLARVGGDLEIFANHYMESLHGLEALRSVGGTLDVSHNSSISSLEPLTGLETVGGHFVLDGNGISDWPTFGKLTRIGGSLMITERNVKRIAGFTALKEAGGLHIRENPALITVEEMPSLRTIYGSAIFAKNPALENLPPFASTGEVRGLIIHGNDALVRSPAFSHLLHIYGDLRIDENPKLAQLDFSKVLSISGDLRLTKSPALTDLSWLRGLQRVYGNVTVNANPALTRVDNLVTFKELWGSLAITNNLTLPACQATKIVDQLKAAGFPRGPIDTSNNEGSGACN